MSSERISSLAIADYSVGEVWALGRMSVISEPELL